MHENRIVPLRFNEAQMALYRRRQWQLEREFPVRLIVCKARRAGLSTGITALIYDDTTRNEFTDSLILAHEKNPSENVLEMCRRFYRETRDIRIGDQTFSVKPKIPPEYNNQLPKDRLVFSEPQSRIFIATARNLDAYLGFRFTNIHATEASSYLDGHELFKRLLPTLLSSAHSALYVESTPNGQSGRGRWFFEQVMDASERTTPKYGDMQLVFIPWHHMSRSFVIPFKSDERRSADERRLDFSKSLDKSELDLLRRFPYISMEQLNWRRVILSGPVFNLDEEAFDEMYPTDLATAFLTSGTTVFGRKTIKRLLEGVRPPIWEGDIYWGESDAQNERTALYDIVRRPVLLTPGEARARGFKPKSNSGYRKNLRVWRWPRKGERIIIGGDVGEGNPESRDGDESALSVGVLNELERDEHIMTWSGHLDPVAFGELAAALANQLQSMVGDTVAAPLLAIEWTGPGTTTNTLIDTKHLYGNLYRYRNPGVHGMPAGKHVGWESNAKSKQLMVGFTINNIAREAIATYDEALITQMSSYRQLDQVGDAQSYGGAAGRHDDLITSFEIMNAVMRLEARAIFSTDEAQFVDMGGPGDEDDLPNFDPFAHDLPVPGIPGMRMADLDEENFENGEQWSW